MGVGWGLFMGHSLCGSTPGPLCPEPRPSSGLMQQPRVSVALGCFLRTCKSIPLQSRRGW